MTTFSNLWQKLRRKAYRDRFAASALKRSIPIQIRALREKRGWSQEELATRSGLTQGVVSRAENPDYGNLTFNTAIRIASGFDCAFVGRFVPFSELGRWFLDFSEDNVSVEGFEDEARSIDRRVLLLQTKTTRNGASTNDQGGEYRRYREATRQSRPRV